MKNQKNVVLAALAAVILAFAVLLYASPYIAMHSIKKALDARDTAALSEYVDFPVLRENIKGRLMSSLADKLPKSEDPNNPLGGIGQAIGNMVVGTAVDNLVSPAGIMMMLQTGQFGPKIPQSASSPAPEEGSAATEVQRAFSLTYQGFNKVRVYRKSEPGNAFIFRRDGLMGWKLVNIDTDS